MEHVKTVKTEETGATWSVFVVKRDPPRKSLVTDPTRHSAGPTAEHLPRVIHHARVIPRVKQSDLLDDDQMFATTLVYENVGQPQMQFQVNEPRLTNISCFRNDLLTTVQRPVVHLQELDDLFRVVYVAWTSFVDEDGVVEVDCAGSSGFGVPVYVFQHGVVTAAEKVVLMSS